MTEPRVQEPPHNIEVEAMLLGAILTNNRAYDNVAGWLKPENFYAQVHGRIFEACAALIEKGDTASPLVLKRRFEGDEALEDAGGAAYLYELATSVVSVVNAREYGNMVKELSQRREGIGAATDLSAELYEPVSERTVAVILDEHEERLDAIRSTGPTGDAEHISGPLRDAIDSIADAMDSETPPGIQTGLIDLDRKLGGLHDGDICYLAARPGMGKTSLATGIAVRVAQDQGTVLFATLEMTKKQLTSRMACERACVEYIDVRRGKIDQRQYGALKSAEAELASLKLHILDYRGLGIPVLRSACRRLRRRQGLDLLIVDYLGLMKPPSDARGRYEQMGALSRGMKQLGGQIGCPTLCLLQMNRGIEQRDNKTPQLSDLRDAGDLEQDADQVVFIHREIKYLEDKEPKRMNFKSGQQGETDYLDAHHEWTMLCDKIATEADIIVAKNRHGATGRLKAYFDASLMSFENAAGAGQEDMVR